MSKLYYQINHSILELAGGMIWVFLKVHPILQNHTPDAHGNNMILHHANIFIVEDNVLQHLSGPSDLTAMKICPKMQEGSYNPSKTFQWQ